MPLKDIRTKIRELNPDVKIRANTVVSDLNIDNNYNEISWGDYNWDKTVYVKANDIKKINKGEL